MNRMKRWLQGAETILILGAGGLILIAYVIAQVTE
jgi:hypothetical protein